MIRLTRPWLGAEEEAAVSAVLRSGMLVQGEQVALFENAVGAYTGRAHAVAVSNGTSALVLALSALGIQRGDRVLCPNLTWPSPAHAILELGAEPVLVDVDLAEWNALPSAMRGAAEAFGPIAAAIAIDQFGNPARVREIAAALATAGPDDAPVPIIADAACSLGSTYDELPCGRFGIIACTSFHPRKVITTGEGGMCLTDDAALASALRELRNHGQSGPGVFGRAAANQRMTELSAAIGCVQMTRLPEIVAARRAIVGRYRAPLEALGLQLQAAAPSAHENHQTLGVLLPEGRERDAVISALAARGVQAGALSYALHALPQLRALPSAQQQSFPNSEAIVRRGLALPLYPGMQESDSERVVDALSEVLG